MKNVKTRMLTVMVLLSLVITTNAQMGRFQAAYVYNITRFLEWSADYKTGDFVICVLGEDEVVGELQKIAAVKNINGQPIKVEVANQVSSVPKCNILFIPTGSSNEIKGAIGAMSGKNTLIVTNHKSGISNGAGINFIVNDNKLQFEMKEANITAHNIKVNSSLEALAVKKY